MIFAVVSLIKQEIWQGILESLPETREIIAHQNETEFIHVSWVVGQQINEKQAVTAIKGLSEIQPAIRVFSGGMGVFGGEKPKIILSLARNAFVDKLHSKIWNKSQSWMTDIKQYYSPDLWMPHITLIRNEFTDQDYLEFLKKSIYTPFEVEIPITNLAILYKNENDAGMLAFNDLKKEQ